MVTIEINQKIISLLERELIAPKHGLVDVYDRIKTYYKRSCEVIDKPSKNDLVVLNGILPQDLLKKSELKKEYSFLIKEKLRSIAIDFPIEISINVKGRKKIMILAMDSLPPNKGSYTDSIIPWAPFSLIYNWDLATRSAKQNIAFFNSLLTDADLYVTDIYKIFYRKGAEGTDNRSNQDKKYVNLNVHKTILEEEIKIVKPDIILTLGNNSRNALYSICKIPTSNWKDDFQEIFWFDTYTRIISIPHISGAANGAKTKILSNPKYKSIPGKNNEKLANIVLSSFKKMSHG